MTIPMSTEERELRMRLDETVRVLRSILGRCPAVDDLALVDIDDAATVVADANRTLADALSCAEALEQLSGASEEAVVLVATSRVALGMVREVLTVLTAAIDGQDLAA